MYSGRQTVHSMPARFLIPTMQVRHASNSKKDNKKNAAPTVIKNKKKGEPEKKKKKQRTTYVQYDMRDSEQFALCDAMR